MAEPPACNASPLIVLTRAGHLTLLQAVYGRVLIPEAVVKEVISGPESDPAVVAVRSEPWLERMPPTEIPSRIAAWDLGVGEAEALAWALRNPGSECLLDDRLGRRCARALGIPVRGTVGIVLLAKRRGIIPAARPVLEALRQAGLFLSPDLYEQALQLAGE